MIQWEDNTPTEYFDLMGCQSFPKQDILAGDKRFEQNCWKIQSELSRAPCREELKMSHAGR